MSWSEAKSEALRTFSGLVGAELIVSSQFLLNLISQMHGRDTHATQKAKTRVENPCHIGRHPPPPMLSSVAEVIRGTSSLMMFPFSSERTPSVISVMVKG